MENARREKEEKSAMLGKYFLKEKKGKEVLNGINEERRFKLEDKRAHEIGVKNSKRQKD